MKIQALAVEAALQKLNSGRQGLTAAEAARRLHEYGPNHIEEVRQESSWRCLLRQFTRFFALLLWVAAGLAFFAEWRYPGTGMQTLGWAILCVIFINGIFSFWQEYRVERALLLLRAMLPRKTRVIREGRALPLSADELVPGDLIQLEQGDIIPADCRFIKAFGVLVNHAALTGESIALTRDTNPVKEENLLHCDNVALAGGSLVAGEAPGRWCSPPACTPVLGRSQGSCRRDGKPYRRCNQHATPAAPTERTLDSSAAAPAFLSVSGGD